MFETCGEVWSSPSYNGEHIFLGSDDGFLYCLDIDGKLRWKTKLKGKVRSSSPCLSSYDEESEYTSVFIGGIFCVNQSTGMIKWSKDISVIFIEADRYRVAQLVTNLLSNALKFVKGYDGLISISIEKKEDVVGGGQEVALVSVKDNGYWNRC